VAENTGPATNPNTGSPGGTGVPPPPGGGGGG